MKVRTVIRLIFLVGVPVYVVHLLHIHHVTIGGHNFRLATASATSESRGGVDDLVRGHDDFGRVVLPRGGADDVVAPRDIVAAKARGPPRRNDDDDDDDAAEAEAAAARDPRAKRDDGDDDNDDDDDDDQRWDPGSGVSVAVLAVRWVSAASDAAGGTMRALDVFSGFRHPNTTARLAA